MKKNNMIHRLILVGISLSLIHPPSAQAQFVRTAPTVAAPDLFPIDRTPPVINDEKNEPPRSNSGGSSSNNNIGVRPANTTPPSAVNRPITSGTPPKMAVARVPEEYSCPVFENRPHQELITAIDSLVREVKVARECSDQNSAKAIDQNAKVIRESVSSLTGVLEVTDPSMVNLSQIDSQVGAAILATQQLSEILNSNAFINSSCGKQALSSGKALLAFNDLLNGLSPYALLAVAMNSALLPALPYVIGGVVTTSAISVMGKMIETNSLSMDVPEHRKAVLVNTCQYLKVAQKVRFMQLAQSGRIEKITEELERNMQLYNTSLSRNGRELSNLLTLKSSIEKNLIPIEDQIRKDRISILDLDAQVAENSDDMMMCLMGSELVQMAKQNIFPQTLINNLDQAATTSNQASKVQVAALKSLHTTSVKRIEALQIDAFEKETSLKSCANASKSWITGLKQALSLTINIVHAERELLEKKLSESVEYRNWKSQYTKIQMQEITIKRVEKAMLELAKDNSIIDRSELAQRLPQLKNGLFGVSGTFSIGNPPVLQWLQHTLNEHSLSLGQFTRSMKALQAEAWSVTDTARSINLPPEQMRKWPAQKAKEDALAAQNLSALSSQRIRPGTREHEIICQKLETAWIDWSSAMDHIGATQFFCDMIDGALDIKMNQTIVRFCRGTIAADGKILKKSEVDLARNYLVQKGHRQEATHVAQQMKQLSCPMPGISVLEN